MEELILWLIGGVFYKTFAWLLAGGNRERAHQIEGRLWIGCLLLIAAPFILFWILLMLSD